MKTTDDTHLKFRDLSFYSAFALPLGFVGIPLYLYAPDFFAVEYGLSLGLLGGILLLLRFVDALQDPYIGALSDRFTDRRSSVVVWSALIMAASFLLLFLPPIGFLKAFGLDEQNAGLLLLWFALFTFLASTGFSVLTINLNT
ncbi:MAG: MFS transporter, partial [Alphaproteobacteria bacterium]